MLRNLTKGWYLCCYKHRCHKSQCLSRCLLPGKNLSFKSEFNNEFNNLIIAIKLPERLIKDSCYSEAATESPISILSFFVGISEKDHFWQCYRLQTCSFINKGILYQAFLKSFAYRFLWQNYRTANLKKIFSIRTLPVVASVHVNNFLKKQKK